MVLEVARVARDEVLDRPLDGAEPRLGSLAAGQVDEARKPLGVDRMIRSCRPDLRHARGVHRRDELDDVGRVVEPDQDAPAPAQHPAEPGRDRQRGLAPRRRLEPRHARATEQAPVLLSLGDRVFGPGDELDRRLVRLAHGRAPGDRAVPLEQQRLRLGPVGDRIGHVARDAEAGAAIRERDDVLAVHTLDHVVRAIVVGQRHDRVGVRVDDRRSREKPVQQGLDRRAHAPWLLQRVSEIAHHLFVAHLGALEERRDVVHPHAREILALDRFEVRAAALDAEHGDLSAAVVPLAGLDRGVAAAPDDERGFGADETRGIDEKIEAVELARLGVVPAGAHAALTIP